MNKLINFVSESWTMLFRKILISGMTEFPNVVGEPNKFSILYK